VTTHKDFNWDHVPTNELQDFCGTNAAQAPTVAGILLKNNPKFDQYRKRECLLRQPMIASPWFVAQDKRDNAYTADSFSSRAEYDAEEMNIRDGNRATSIEEFGGKVQQRIHLAISKTADGLAFKFTLEQPTKSKSSRFSRFLGSRRLIECHFSKKEARDYKKEIIDFFVSKKLLINGRLFQAFYGHERKIELMEINEDFGREPQPLLGDDNRISLMDLISWHNNLHLNANQTINKWVSRFALGFSTSQPGLVFQPKNMHFWPDTCKIFKIGIFEF
jgi:hypothetical protein